MPGGDVAQHPSPADTTVCLFSELMVTACIILVNDNWSPRLIYSGQQKSFSTSTGDDSEPVGWQVRVFLFTLTNYLLKRENTQVK